MKIRTIQKSYRAIAVLVPLFACAPDSPSGPSDDVTDTDTDTDGPEDQCAEVQQIINNSCANGCHGAQSLDGLDLRDSSAVEFPVLMVGGENMGLKNDGRTTVFPGVSNSNNRQLSNLFNTLGYAAGMTLDDFGTEGPSRIAPGPLSELWS